VHGQKLRQCALRLAGGSFDHIGIAEGLRVAERDRYPWV
jgi:hypothetical protein